ncbi:MAG: sigma-70 family RNA polymerase sigma factor [Gemmataceae bacterium]
MTDWSAMIRNYGPLVWRTAYRLLTHEADAADCFQQTFLDAVQLERSKTVSHWPAALIRIATTRALDRLRERYRTSARWESLSENHADRRIDEVIGHAMAEEITDHLRFALTVIDPQQAAVFSLIVLEGCSYEVAASEMKMTTNHVGVLLNRAKAALREKLVAFAPLSKGAPS